MSTTTPLRTMNDPSATRAVPGTPGASTTTSAAPGTPTPAVLARDLVKTFGRVAAVDGISLEIPRGTIIALLGKNGAGKTTLIDMLLGLQRPDRGEARLFGFSPRDAIRRSLVGAVLQTGALPGDHTVVQALRLFAASHDRPLPLDRIMSETHLEGLAKRRISKLSGGEQQRVRLALALLPDPHLLILDEPTAGMDATARREFWDLMRVQAEAGRTILFATHYLAEAEEFAERTVIVKDGRVVADAPTDELRRTSTTRTLRILLPDSSRDLARRALADLPGAEDFRISWSPVDADPGVAALELVGSDTDAAARALLALRGAHGLEIASASLEETFARLTA